MLLSRYRRRQNKPREYADCLYFQEYGRSSVGGEPAPSPRTFHMKQCREPFQPAIQLFGHEE